MSVYAKKMRDFPDIEKLLNDTQNYIQNSAKVKKLLIEMNQDIIDMKICLDTLTKSGFNNASEGQYIIDNNLKAYINKFDSSLNSIVDHNLKADILIETLEARNRYKVNIQVINSNISSPDFALIRSQINQKLKEIYFDKDSMERIKKREGLTGKEVIVQHANLLTWMEEDFNHALSRQLIYKNNDIELDDGRIRISLLFNYKMNLIISLEFDITHDWCSIGLQDENGYIHEGVFGEINDLEHEINLDETLEKLEVLTNQYNNLSL